MNSKTDTGNQFRKAATVYDIEKVLTYLENVDYVRRTHIAKNTVVSFSKVTLALLFLTKYKLVSKVYCFSNERLFNLTGGGYYYTIKKKEDIPENVFKISS